MASFAGDFALAMPVERYPAGTLVPVSVSPRHPSRVMLDFTEHEVLTDAGVLLCGHVGALELLKLGYAGPLARRPPLASGDHVAAAKELTPGPASRPRRA